jgi:hypothetical protein
MSALLHDPKADKLAAFQCYAGSRFTPPWEARKYDDYCGQRPCIRPRTLRNFLHRVDERIQLRSRVARDNADEVCPPLTADDAAGFAVIPLFILAGVIINRGPWLW